MALTDTATALTAPASVTVPASATSASLTVSTGTLTTNQTATLTASLNNSTATASISLVVQVSVNCGVSSLTPSSSTVCTVVLPSAAPGGGTPINLSSSSSVLTIPSSVTVPGNSVSVSFAVVAAAFTSAQSAVISAKQGSQTATTTISLTTQAPSTLFLLNGNNTEVTATTNGSPVNAEFAPAGMNGKVVVNGTGSVNLVPGSGVYFLNCCGNYNNAYYQFTGSGVGSVFKIPQGQISFTLTSRYSFAQRQSTAASMRLAFSARDGNSQNQFYFMTQPMAQYLVFYYMIQGTAGNYYVPRGTEDQLFGDGVSLGVTLKWDGATASLYLNGTPVSSSPYVPAGANWNAAALFDLGAWEDQNYGGYNSSDDLISGFAVGLPGATLTGQTSSKLVSAVSEQSPAIQKSPAALPPESGHGPAALSCGRTPIMTGSSAVCQLLISGTGNPTEYSLTSSSEHVRVPATVSARPGQTQVHFEVLTDDDAPEGMVSVEAHAGADAIQGTLDVARSEAPRLRVAASQTGTPGAPVHFDVVANDERPFGLTASELPSGAVFDTASGAFTWVPTEQDRGSHSIRFSATNSLGLSTSKTVTVKIATEPEAGRPTIFTMGESDQALALHSGSTVPAAIPSIRYTGQAARAGDLISIFAAGVSCDQDPAAQNLRVRFGTGYAPIRSIQPAGALTGVCEVSIEVPSGAPELKTPIFLEVADGNGHLVTSNTVSIAVEN